MNNSAQIMEACQVFTLKQSKTKCKVFFFLYLLYSLFMWVHHVWWKSGQTFVQSRSVRLYWWDWMRALKIPRTSTALQSYPFIDISQQSPVAQLSTQEKSLQAGREVLFLYPCQISVMLCTCTGWLQVWGAVTCLPERHYSHTYNMKPKAQFKHQCITEEEIMVILSVTGAINVDIIPK